MPSTIPQPLPRPADPDYQLSAAERDESLVWQTLERAILSLLEGAAIAPAERSAILAGALQSEELQALSWCPACRATAEGLCYDHAGGVTLADAVRAHAYRRLPGRPLLDLDL